MNRLKSFLELFRSNLIQYNSNFIILDIKNSKFHDFLIYQPWNPVFSILLYKITSNNQENLGASLTVLFLWGRNVVMHFRKMLEVLRTYFCFFV